MINIHMKSLATFIAEQCINEESIEQTTLYFAGQSPMIIFIWEMSGQISDGKYENSRPFNHWKWVTNVKFDTCEHSKEHYSGLKHNKTYTIQNLARKCNGNWSGNYGWCNRIQWYGAFGLALLESSLAETLGINPDDDSLIKFCKGDGFGVRSLLEYYGEWQATAKNPDDFDEFYENTYSFVKKQIDKLSKKKCAAICKETRNQIMSNYTNKSFMEDIESMEMTVNNWE